MNSTWLFLLLIKKKKFKKRSYIYDSALDDSTNLTIQWDVRVPIPKRKLLL